MNRIVKKNYPVEKLPADLKEGLPIGGYVDVTVEETPSSSLPRSGEAFLAELDEIRKDLKHPVTAEESVERIRKLRDEWDD